MPYFFKRLLPDEFSDQTIINTVLHFVPELKLAKRLRNYCGWVTYEDNFDFNELTKKLMKFIASFPTFQNQKMAKYVFLHKNKYLHEHLQKLKKNT